MVTPALERLVEANTLLSGLGFESSGLAAAHAIHNGLTTAAGTHAYLHGEKVSFGLMTQLVLEGQPRSVLHQVLKFATDVGLPVTLEQIKKDPALANIIDTSQPTNAERPAMMANKWRWHTWL